nr:hypothetical protein [Tanacetum cinerariifolium]
MIQAIDESDYKSNLLLRSPTCISVKCASFKRNITSHPFNIYMSKSEIVDFVSWLGTTMNDTHEASKSTGQDIGTRYSIYQSLRMTGLALESPFLPLPSAVQ